MRELSTPETTQGNAEEIFVSSQLCTVDTLTDPGLE